MATGTGNLPYPGKSYTPFDILTAEELNEDVANIESLATGAGIGDKAITAHKIDFATSIDNGWTVRDYGNFKEYSVRTPSINQNASAGFVTERYQLNTIALPSGLGTFSDYRQTVQQVGGTDVGRVNGAIGQSGSNIVLWGVFNKATTAAQNFTGVQFDIILVG